MATRKRTLTVAIPARIARTRLGSILRRVAQKNARFVITKNGKATAVLLSAQDFDDMLDERDTEFQKRLEAAAKEYRAGKSVTLKEYLKERLARRAG